MRAQRMAPEEVLDAMRNLEFIDLDSSWLRI
jgi:hypothetical protein